MLAKITPIPLELFQNITSTQLLQSDVSIKCFSLLTQWIHMADNEMCHILKACWLLVGYADITFYHST